MITIRTRWPAGLVGLDLMKELLKPWIPGADYTYGMGVLGHDNHTRRTLVILEPVTPAQLTLILIKLTGYSE